MLLSFANFICTDDFKYCVSLYNSQIHVSAISKFNTKEEEKVVGMAVQEENEENKEVEEEEEGVIRRKTSSLIASGLEIYSWTHLFPKLLPCLGCMLLLRPLLASQASKLEV